MEPLLTTLAEYGYFVLLPLAIVEGPVVTVLGGFLCTLGVLHPLPTFALVVSGDLIGDSFLYASGRYGGTRLLSHCRRYFALADEDIAQARAYFSTHHRKALVLAKIVHGMGATALVTAGMLKMPYARFISTCTIVAILQSALLLTLGVYFGHAYAQLNAHLNQFTALTIALAAAIGTFVLGRRIARRR